MSTPSTSANRPRPSTSADTLRLTVAATLLLAAVFGAACTNTAASKICADDAPDDTGIACSADEPKEDGEAPDTEPADAMQQPDSNAPDGSTSGDAGAPDGPMFTDGGLVPVPPTTNVYPICVTQIDGGVGQSTGMVCGYNPNFVPDWSGGLPNTCLDINTCTTTLGGVTYVGPPSVTLQVTSGYPTVLHADILNCTTDPRNDNGNSCIPSNDTGGRPFAHSLSWGMPNGDVGPSTTLTITQTGTSDTTSYAQENLPLDQWPGNYVLIYDPYGNADIFVFGTSGCEVIGAGPDTCM